MNIAFALIDGYGKLADKRGFPPLSFSKSKYLAQISSFLFQCFKNIVFIQILSVTPLEIFAQKEINTTWHAFICFKFALFLMLNLNSALKMKFLLTMKILFSSKIYVPVSRWYKNRQLKKKIKRILKKKQAKELTASQKQNIRSFYKTYGVDDIDTSWHRFYTSSNGNFSVEYVPETIFYQDIENKLNNQAYVLALADKSLLDRLFPDIKQPETVIKNINGFYYAHGKIIDIREAIEICNGNYPMFIKPTSDTGGGKNVKCFTCKNGIINDNGRTIEDFLSSYNKNFIIQKQVQQHELLAVLNPTSLNTFRVMSYLRDTEVVVLSTIVRIGRKGSITDNSTTGGISCGVRDDGRLNETGFQLSGVSYIETDTGIKFTDVTLPFMEKIHSTVQKLHKSAPFFRLVSWDLAIDNKGEIVFIEYNVFGQDANFHQLNNGPVLAELLNGIKF